MRQQFSNRENVEISQFTTAFIKNAAEHLAVDGHDAPDIQFRERGYLMLCSPGAGEDILRENHALQRSLDCPVELLDPAALEARFPWLSLDGVALGCLGTRHEGYFDPVRRLPPPSDAAAVPHRCCRLPPPALFPVVSPACLPLQGHLPRR